MGGRQSNSTYQYTLKSDNDRRPARLGAAAGRGHEAPAGAGRRGHRPAGERRRDLYVEVDKDRAARLGITSRDVDNALYNAFGQRQVATIYDELNQYRVIMEVAPRYIRSPEALKDIYVPARGTAAPDRPRQLDQHQRHGHRRPAARRTSQQSRPARRSTGQPVSTTRHDDGAAVGDRALRRAAHADLGQPPGRRARHHHLLQPRRRAATLADGAGGRAPGRGRDRHADQRARQLPGHGAAGAGIASSSRC